MGYVERDAFAAAILVAPMADQALDSAPVWDDLETFDGTEWRDRVDLLSAGFPCQPFSAAGRGRGIDDDRWLWPHIARIIDEVAPSFVFCENVPPLRRRGLAYVLEDLARLGFDVEWAHLSAAAVGATHRRDRLWVLAYRHGQRLPRLWWQSGHHRQPRDDADRPGRAALDGSGRPGRSEVPAGAPGDEGPDARRTTQDDHFPHGCCQGLAHAGDVAESTVRYGRGIGEGARPRAVEEPAPDVGYLADTAGTGRQRGVHRPPPRWEGPAWQGDDLPLFPPGPDDHDAWADVLAAEGPQPAVGRMADGLAHRVDRLRAIGNGVVPLVAAHAFVGLARRAGLLDDDPPKAPDG